MGRPPKFSEAPGLYKQTGRNAWWLRYSVGGKQIRVPLGTDDYAEAVERAKKERGKLPTASAPLVPWQTSLEKYLEFKSDAGTHRKATTEKVGYAAKQFFRWTELSSPAEVTKEIIDLYYSAHRSKRPDEDFKKKKKPTPTKAGDFRNTATAQGYVNSVAAFLRWTGNVIKITFPREEVPTKTLVVGRLLASELIALTARKDLRYVLYAGFYAGMRKAEIVMARPAWFDIANDVIRIPHIEESHGRFFETKSGRGRPVPLDREFKQFLTQEYTAWKSMKYMVHEDAKGERYRWDPRQPMETLFEKHGLRKPRYKNMARFKKVKSSEKAASTKTRIENDLAAAEIAWGKKPEMTLHTMRHSYGSHHVRRGVPIARVALWMGDRQRTVESNYLHEDVDSFAEDRLTASEQLVQIKLAADAGDKKKMAALISDLPDPRALEEYDDPESIYYINALGVSGPETIS